jgi:hypothetical protein
MVLVAVQVHLVVGTKNKWCSGLLYFFLIFVKFFKNFNGVTDWRRRRATVFSLLKTMLNATTAM